MMFVAYDVCCIIMFVANYDVCRLYCLSQYQNQHFTFYIGEDMDQIFPFSHKKFKLFKLFSLRVYFWMSQSPPPPLLVFIQFFCVTYLCSLVVVLSFIWLYLGVFWMHIQNVQEKTPQDEMSQGKNVPGTKHPREKTSQGTKHPREKTSQGTKRPRDNMSQGTKLPKGQNVRRDKTSQNTKRPRDKTSQRGQIRPII